MDRSVYAAIKPFLYILKYLFGINFKLDPAQPAILTFTIKPRREFFYELARVIVLTWAVIFCTLRAMQYINSSESINAYYNDSFVGRVEFVVHFIYIVQFVLAYVVFAMNRDKIARLLNGLNNFDAFLAENCAIDATRISRGTFMNYNYQAAMLSFNATKNRVGPLESRERYVIIAIALTRYGITIAMETARSNFNETTEYLAHFMYLFKDTAEIVPLCILYLIYARFTRAYKYSVARVARLSRVLEMNGSVEKIAAELKVLLENLIVVMNGLKEILSVFNAAFNLIFLVEYNLLLLQLITALMIVYTTLQGDDMWRGNENDNFTGFVIKIVTVVASSTFLMIILYLSELIQNQKSYLAASVHKFDFRTMPKDVKLKTKSFSLQAHVWKSRKLTVCGLFPINMETLFMIISSVASNVIILIQFYSSEKKNH